MIWENRIRNSGIWWLWRDMLFGWVGIVRGRRMKSGMFLPVVNVHCEVGGIDWTDFG